ncbi:hypothetical protein [Phaeodactylibacter sp.]|uniref:hypothetical protein n=1 Tax=Phaeodactylibacter sp. TaxID=1940289 RepID=UPI0025FE57CA|nr:hypothetical protein [Phaeodactylibacter sp.]MCI4647409.1 hypothetical protein [Phaeodactylibacter sp.]MCI5090005.1 hypothetical protein [Phaeodactylibacter sp.]
MEKYQLYELLGALTSGEIRKLRWFLSSGYATKREELHLMLGYLVERKAAKRPWPELKLLYKHAFPGQPYDNQQLRNAMSELHALLEDFLLMEEARASGLPRTRQLAKLYRQRRLGRHFQRTMRRQKQQLERQPLRNADYYQALLTYQVSELEHQADNRRTEPLQLQEIADTLDVDYLARKLRHACTQRSHEAVFKKSYDYGLLEPLISQIEAGGYLQYPAVALYYHCFRFLGSTEQEKHFLAFRELQQACQGQFTAEEQKDLYMLALNFCIRQINTGNIFYAEESWRLYQDGLTQEVLFDSGMLSRFTFNNIVAVGIRLGYLDAVRALITEYSPRLPEAYRKSASQFNQARLHFAEQDYDRARQLLLTTEITDLVNDLIARTLLLKIYYEQGEYELLEAHLERLRSFVARREFSQYHRENYGNIIRIVRQLVALPPYDVSGRARVRKEVENMQPLTERSWLLSKIPGGPDEASPG